MKARYCASVTLGLLASLGSGLSFGQSISINRGDLPASGDTLRYSNALPEAVDLDSIASGGPGRVWRFGSLAPVSQDIAAYKSAIQINVAYGLFFGFTSFGLKVADSVGVGNIQARDVYDFYRNSQAAYTAVGRGLTFTGLPLPSNYSDVDELYKYPLNYTDVDSGTFKVVFTVPNVGSWTQTGTRKTEADGWGSITTPYGTFNCLRVKQTVNQMDTLRATQLPIPIFFATNTVAYQWLARGQHYPILEVTVSQQFGVDAITSVTYRDVKRIILPSFPVANFFALQRNINSGDSVLLFNTSQPGQQLAYNWQVTPSAGVRFAAGTTAASATAIIAFGQPGVYSIRLFATNAAGTDDSLRTDYITVTDPSAVRNPTTAAPWLAPNPASQSLHLLLPGQGWLVQIADAKGATVKAFFANTSAQRINTLAPGLYTVRALRGAEVRTQTLVIER